MSLNSFDGARVHIVGVGGAGMSGVATMLVEMGALVSGSDAVDSDALRALRGIGVEVHVGHDAHNGEGADFITWSPAVARENREVARSIASGAEPLARAQMLARLAALSPMIGLTGTHGKTTATSMMVHVMLAAGRDCSRLLGAPVTGAGANGHWGADELILEVDESYGSFALVTPMALGLLNVEADHLDHYGSLDALEEAFTSLVDRTTGPVVVWTSDAGAQRVASRSQREVTTVGLSGADVVVDTMELRRRSSSFSFLRHGRRSDVELQVTGEHNVANAAVVATLALELGVELDAVTTGLRSFQGAPRRFQPRGTWHGIDLYEDYAHLPGEVVATIRATRAAGYERVGIVFQPHRVTRTLNLVHDFSGAFAGVSQLVVTDIYTAGESNPAGVTGQIVSEAVERHSGSPVTHYIALLDDVPALIEGWVGKVDVVLFVGAGDVAGVIDHLEGVQG